MLLKINVGSSMVRLVRSYRALLMTLAAGSLGAGGVARAQGAAATPVAETIYRNAHVYTVDAKNSQAEAVAIAGGKFLAAGSNAEIDKLRGPATNVIDASGKTIVPGLIDAHGHMLDLGNSLQRIDLRDTTSYEQIISKVVERAKTVPKGDWILGRGWDQNDWALKDFPDEKELSAAVPDHPVYLVRVDGHAGLANAAALKLAGITAATKDPEGGKIERRKGTQEPLGVFVDGAQTLVASKIPASSDDQIRRAMNLAISECQKYGLTSVHDPGISLQALDVYKKMVDDKQFDLRVYALIRPPDIATVEKVIARGPLVDYGDHRLTQRSFKITIDGALGSRGAALLAPYADSPGNSGLIVVKPEFLREVTQRALAGGFQVCCHAIGDRGNRLVLDVFEDELKKSGKQDARLRIEHAQIVALEDIPRFAKLGVIPSMQPTHATSDMPWAEVRVGPERIKGAYAWQRYLELGCRIPCGSDFPVESVNPLWGVFAAITRQDHNMKPAGGWMPDQRMTRQEALRGFTIDAAWAGFMEKEIGSIEPGKLADLTILSQDVMTIAPEEILKTVVDTTVLGGKEVYKRK